MVVPLGSKSETKKFHLRTKKLGKSATIIDRAACDDATSKSNHRQAAGLTATGVHIFCADACGHNSGAGGGSYYAPPAHL